MTRREWFTVVTVAVLSLAALGYVVLRVVDADIERAEEQLRMELP